MCWKGCTSCSNIGLFYSHNKKKEEHYVFFVLLIGQEMKKEYLLLLLLIIPSKERQKVTKKIIYLYILQRTWKTCNISYFSCQKIFCFILFLHLKNLILIFLIHKKKGKNDIKAKVHTERTKILFKIITYL